MDKKNTMLLTVIAVATLLVAVVGATFAYFAVTGENTTQNSVVTTTAEEVGTVALSGQTIQHITIAAADMAVAKAGTPYYSTETEGVPYNTTAQSYEVALAEVTGGLDTTNYKCEFNVNVEIAGDMKESLTAGDASLVFEGALTGTHDLTTVATQFPVEMNLTGNGDTADVKAYVIFNNRADADGVVDSGKQNALAGKTLTVTLSNTDWVCDTVE